MTTPAPESDVQPPAPCAPSTPGRAELLAVCAAVVALAEALRAVLA